MAGEVVCLSGHSVLERSHTKLCRQLYHPPKTVAGRGLGRGNGVGILGYAYFDEAENGIGGGTGRCAFPASNLTERALCGVDQQGPTPPSKLTWIGQVATPSALSEIDRVSMTAARGVRGESAPGGTSWTAN